MAIKIIIFAILLLAITGCTLIQEIPTLVPEIRFNQEQEDPKDAQGSTNINESPRPDSKVNIPPTWTPPVESNSRQQDPPANVPDDSSAPGQQTYIVQNGDTLGEIASRFSVTVEALAQANGITDLDHIEEGQVLVIPGA